MTRKIVLTGGGSGGHITPVLAVAHQLKQIEPDCQTIYIGQAGDSLGDIPAQSESIDAVYTVRAGKLRRYHGEGWKQLLDVPTMAKNFRDILYVLMGIVQSRRLLKRLKPDVLFVKGGFVGVPVGLAAASLKIPFVTHDSDALPGLANRIIARWAAKHAVALPKELYSYPPDKTVTVGVPISHKFTPVDVAGKLALRQQVGLGEYEQLVFVTGGGLGAQRMNDGVQAVVPGLLRRYPKLAVVHLSGRSLEAEVSKKYNDTLSVDDRKRVIVEGFSNRVADYSGAADVVITRAGGTAMAEFAAQAKACVVVPNPMLTGGHQSKNAQGLAKLGVAVIVEESELKAGPDHLTTALVQLLDHPEEASALGARLYTIAKPDAARELAALILAEVKR